ncbi:hypothetical protein CYY_007889 [Polysphondylium violaceum]|uniref:Uncharacterized protein n=1 Tax=Polysphondylium violaceum TaxID=133409 RepID=A0A8J4UXR9_9MYCE|nr:hypothetical protein CYY_007889 [Polysphondylium violaceum]
MSNRVIFDQSTLIQDLSKKSKLIQEEIEREIQAYHSNLTNYKNEKLHPIDTQDYRDKFMDCLKKLDDQQQKQYQSKKGKYQIMLNFLDEYAEELKKDLKYGTNSLDKEDQLIIKKLETHSQMNNYFIFIAKINILNNKLLKNERKRTELVNSILEKNENFNSSTFSNSIHDDQ